MTQLSATARVVLLLRTFNEARVSYSVESTGNGLTLMPSDWHEGSYEELERRLVEQREAHRELWRHVGYRYRWGDERLIVCPVVRRMRGSEFVLPGNCELIAGGPSVGNRVALARVYRWADFVDDGKVVKGVTMLTESMFAGEHWRIMLPLSLLRRELGLPVEGERELAA